MTMKVRQQHEYTSLTHIILIAALSFRKVKSSDSHQHCTTSLVGNVVKSSLNVGFPFAQSKSNKKTKLTYYPNPFLSRLCMIQPGRLKDLGLSTGDLNAVTSAGNISLNICFTHLLHILTLSNDLYDPTDYDKLIILAIWFKSSSVFLSHFLIFKSYEFNYPLKRGEFIIHFFLLYDHRNFFNFFSSE